MSRENDVVMAGLERETKLDVDEGFKLPDLTSSLGLTVVTEPERELVATYYDTAELDLARWGATLRYRTTDDRDGRWTLKLPTDGSTGGPTMSRDEIDFDAGPEAPPTAALNVVTALRRGRPVEAVAVLTTTRRTHSLVGDGDRKLAEIDEDRVRYSTPKGRSGDFQEVEVELAPDAPGSFLDTVTEALIKADARRATSEPKLLRALGERPDPAVMVLDVSSDATAKELIGRAVASSVHRLFTHEPGVRLGTDAEAVHQARVATRRLRSDLGTVEDFLAEGWATELREDLRELGSRLGAVRDADVLLERLRDAADHLPASDRPAAESVLKSLGSERESHRQSLLAYMESPGYVGLVDTLLDASREQPVGDPGARATVLKPVVAKRWKKLAKRVRLLGPEPSDDELHRVRIDAKRCRYAVELLAPVGGKPAKNLAAAVADLQTVLGDLHDAVVAESWLRQAAASVYPEVALVAGELAAAERQAQADCRNAWPGVWKAAHEKKLRAWLS